MSGTSHKWMKHLGSGWGNRGPGAEGLLKSQLLVLCHCWLRLVSLSQYVCLSAFASPSFLSAVKSPDPVVIVLNSSLDKEQIWFSKLLKGLGMCGSIRFWEEAHREQRLAGTMSLKELIPPPIQSWKRGQPGDMPALALSLNEQHPGSVPWGSS